MAAQSLIHRPGVPTVNNDRSIAHVGTQEQTVQLSPRAGVERRAVPTEMFVSSISLRRMRTKSRAANAPETGSVSLENVDYARLVFSPDGRVGVFNGFWWASSPDDATSFWTREFKPPSGYEIVAKDTVRIPRHLLEKSPYEKIGRAHVVLSLFALAGVTISGRGRHTAYASYIRADSVEMALRLWHTSANGLPVSEQRVMFALAVPAYWMKGVLASPPIMEALEHDRPLLLGR